MPALATADSCSDVRQLAPNVLTPIIRYAPPSGVQEVVTNKRDLDRARVTTRTIYLSEVQRGHLSVGDDDLAGTEGLGVFATGYGGDCERDEFAAVALPEINNRSVLDGIERTGESHFGHCLWSFYVVYSLTYSVCVLLRSSGIFNPCKRGKIKLPGRSLYVVLALTGGLDLHHSGKAGCDMEG
jgi:hypothetical protein